MLIVVGLAWPLAHQQPGLIDQLTTRPWLWRWFLSGYLIVTIIVLFYQVIYWNFVRKKEQVSA